VAPEENALGWGIKWSNLSLREMAAFLQLTPSEDFAEYQHLKRHHAYQEKKEREKKDQLKEGKTAGYTLEDFLSSDYFELGGGSEELERYRLRLETLLSFRAWWRKSDGLKDLDEIFDGPYKAIVVDLSSDDEQVRMITAARALETLWRKGLDSRRDYLKKLDVCLVITRNLPFHPTATLPMKGASSVEHQVVEDSVKSRKRIGGLNLQCRRGVSPRLCRRNTDRHDLLGINQATTA
jgi:hypothetical protein